MRPLTGRNEVRRMRARLQQIIDRAEAVDVDDYELKSDLAMLLCIRISGYVEQSFKELATDFARRTSSGPIRSFVAAQFDWTRNPSSESLLEELRSFDLTWATRFESFCDQRRKDGLNSIVGLRNDIAHGRGTRPSLGRVLGYLEAVDEMVEELAEIFDPGG
jgi:hypothetical protein